MGLVLLMEAFLGGKKTGANNRNSKQWLECKEELDNKASCNSKTDVKLERTLQTKYSRAGYTLLHTAEVSWMNLVQLGLGLVILIAHVLHF